MGDVFEMPHQKTARLSLSDFLAQLQAYQDDIMQIHSQVLRAYNLFGQSGIWADQIDRATQMLQTMGENTKTFCDLLSPLALLPDIVGPLRYPLIKMLYHIDMLISDLIGHLALFRPNCRTSSRKTITQRQEIQRKLELLLQSLKEVNQIAELLPERIAIQERIYANA
jgi:hypothetical protein